MPFIDGRGRKASALVTIHLAVASFCFASGPAKAQSAPQPFVTHVQPVQAPAQQVVSAEPDLIAATIARTATLGGDENRTQFVAGLSKAVKVNIFTLADPYRVVVELPEVKFQLPQGLGKNGHGLVKSYRYGLFMAGKSRIVLEMIDASALLWRLELRGVDVGARWSALADAWEAHASSDNYAFNDVHAAMAFLRAGRPAALATLLDSQGRAMAREDDNAIFTSRVGHPVTRALMAFDAGLYAEAANTLRSVRNGAALFGGSHAQRDLLDLTLIEAARRLGDARLYAALSAERLVARPGSPWTLPVSAAA